MDANLNTNVENLMFDFLGALNTLVPTLQRTKILSDGLIGHDGWELISESLFRAIVEDSIFWSLNDADAEKFKLLTYGFVDCDTKAESYIQVALKSNPNSLFVFGGFTTSSGKLFDQVVIQEISDSKAGEITKCKISDVDFSCAFFNGKSHIVLKNISL